MTPDDGATIYDAEGHKIGTIHWSPRTRRWFHKGPSRTGAISRAIFHDAQEAADSLRAGVTV